MSAPASYINPTVNVKQQPNQAYVALQAFDTQLSNYTTSLNPQFQTIGEFSNVPNATAANCPAGRVVYATGKVLVPGANPNVTTPMIKIMDPNSGLSGFVTLNPVYFAPYSQVLSVQNTTSDVNGTLSLTTDLGGAGSNASVGGSLTVDNGLTVNAGGATITAGGLTVTAGVVSIGDVLRFSGGTDTSAFSATTGAVIFTPTTGNTFYKLTSTGAVTGLTCTSLPASGTVVIVIFAGNFNITIGAGFSVQPTFNPGLNSVVVTYISNGTVLIEISRITQSSNVAGPT
jgi:hypothetical protein